MDCNEIVAELKAMRNEKNIEGMARFGINSEGTLGVPIPVLRKIAKRCGQNHELAIELWNTGIHEARILAGFIANPEIVSEKLIESWLKDFDSWDVCDQVCSNFFGETKFAWAKAKEWCDRKREFEKRAGFVLMAVLAVHDKESSDARFEKFFPLMKREACDERNFVKKAVNWALRQIGKRNPELKKKAISVAKEILLIDCKSARWIAMNALQELEKKKF